ncbi:MAG: metal-dependent hydrolase [Flammeovirgaceae bacterium]
MSGANHIVGGTVFTGIFASFWNVNIFEKPVYLFFTAFFAILPDVDHLKSPIGKIFYPVAKWLNIKYGHRTITHSLICYFSLFAIVTFIDSTTGGNGDVTLIFGFSYFSHLLFDMVTKQGIPLFWPFLRNPCVIPANPEMRLKSSHFQTEAICFAIFILLGITCQPLFAQGFWTSYNKVFEDLKHLHQESRMSETLLKVDYKFIREGKEITGSGLLVESKETEAIILSNQFEKITAENKIVNLIPSRSHIKMKTSDFLFFNINQDSLRSLLSNKKILQLKMQSTSAFAFVKDNKPQSSKSVEFEFVVNPILSFLPDTLSKSIENQMQLLNYELQKSQSQSVSIQSRRHAINAGIDSLTSSISQMDLYTREKAVKKISELKKELEATKSDDSNAGKITLQLQHLKKELDNSKITLVSGYIKFIDL